MIGNHFHVLDPYTILFLSLNEFAVLPLQKLSLSSQLLILKGISLHCSLVFVHELSALVDLFELFVELFLFLSLLLLLLLLSLFKLLSRFKFHLLYSLPLIFKLLLFTEALLFLYPRLLSSVVHYHIFLFADASCELVFLLQVFLSLLLLFSAFGFLSLDKPFS